jgi:hypothetical protein
MTNGGHAKSSAGGRSTVRIRTLKNDLLLCERCRVADSFWSRLLGLMGQAALGPDEGVWLRPCGSIHMWFMRFSIDAVFVGPAEAFGEKRRLQVRSVRAGLKPWRLLPVADAAAEGVLELRAGTATRLEVAPGDWLCID